MLISLKFNVVYSNRVKNAVAENLGIYRHGFRCAQLLYTTQRKTVLIIQGRSRRSGHGLATYSATKYFLLFSAFQSHSPTPRPYNSTSALHGRTTFQKSRLRPCNLTSYPANSHHRSDMLTTGGGDILTCNFVQII